MKLSVENKYSGTPELTYASHIAVDAREQACQESGAISWDVTVTPKPTAARPSRSIG